MQCKRCGYNIEKGWKYCPNCSKKIHKIQNVILVGALIGLVIYCVGPTIKSYIEYKKPVDEKYIEKVLEKKYNEDFNDVTLIKSVENQDEDLSCDGSNFGTIKGEGNTNYFKIYSKKNDIEFIAKYNEANILKEVNDTYQKNLNRRKSISEAYKIIDKYLQNINYKITLTEDDDEDKEMSFDSEEQLWKVLSKCDSEHERFDSISIYIEEDLFTFCKSNYEMLTKLNDELVELRYLYDYYFFTYIYLNSNAMINLYRLDDKAYVYDSQSNSNASGVKLDDFVKRESY